MAKSYQEIFANFASVMELLRDEKFQYLLENYERAKKDFIVGYEVRDEVTSEILFEADGKHDLRPEDYLLAFTDFIRQNNEKIAAIGILLNKPRNWNTKALTELKEKLKENDFEEPKLQKAHKIVYQKDLVDIISMIKHAVSPLEPLLSVDERVDNAIKKVLLGKQLTYDQLNWINYIKFHLKQNLTLDENDFKELPVFVDRGGWRKFKKLFPDNYNKLIAEINETIAA